MRLVVLLALAACEKEGAETFAIGWEGPKAGEQVEVLSRMTSGDHVFFEHALFEHATIDREHERITSEKVRYLAFQVDGEPIPRASCELVEKNGKVEVLGDVPPGQRASELESARLTFADPAPRKRFSLHRFHIGERYKLRADEADAMGLDSTDVALTLRSAHEATCMFDLEGTAMREGAKWQFHGTLETNGPNYRYFHEIIDFTSEVGTLHLDHLQKKPSL
jgi:hypothetical protein